jgi:hypothetical protein
MSRFALSHASLVASFSKESKRRREGSTDDDDDDIDDNDGTMPGLAALVITL